AWTRKALWQAIEQPDGPRYTDGLFALNLLAHRDALHKGIAWYRLPSAESRTKVTKDAEAPKAKFVLRMSSLMRLDEVQCQSILETCIKNDIEAPAALRRLDWSQMTEINYDDEHLDTAVQQQYLDEREETLLALAAVLRAAEDDDHDQALLIQQFVQKMCQDTEQFGTQLCDQLRTAIAGSIPPDVAKHDTWASTWAQQYVKEQKILLQIIFLFQHTIAPSPSSLAKTLMEILLGDFNLGRAQKNEHLLGKEAQGMLRVITDTCVMLAIQAMDLRRLLRSPGASPFVEAPEAIHSIYQRIETRAATGGKGDPIGPILLAWGLVVQSIYPALEARDTDDYESLCRFITEDAANPQLSSRIPQMLVQNAYLKAKAMTYLVGALQGPMMANEHDALGYRGLVKDLIGVLLEVIGDANLLPERETLIRCMSLLLANEEQLSLDWFEDDYISTERRSLLDSAQRLFPIYFVPFIQFLRSLINSSDTGSRVFQHFASLSTLADYIRPDEYAENPFQQGRNGQNIVSWTGSARGIVHGARDLFIKPPEGTCGQKINNEPPVVLLEFPYSGWHLMLSVVDAFLHGTDAAIPHLDRRVVATPEIVAEILDMFNALLQHADDQLLEGFMSHLSVFAASWKDTASERFVGMICEILNKACTLPRPPIKLVTCCMKCLATLLPHFPDAVWKNLRVDGLFPRFSPSEGLLSTNSYMQEVILPAENAAGRYPTTIAFLDLVLALIKDAQTLRPQAAPLTPEEQALEAEFWEARSNSRRMAMFEERIGGTAKRKDLQQKLLAHARIKDASVLRCEVLQSAVMYIHSQVFPRHSTWRYAHMQHKYQLGLKILRMFNQIMSDSTWSQPSGPIARNLDFSVVQEYLARNYLVDGSLYQLTPLIDIVALGNECPMRFHRSSHTRSAKMVEECIENALSFIKHLLKRRKTSELRISLLEHALLDRTVHHGSQDDAVELVQVLGRYIQYEAYPPLPVLATQVLTLLCAVAADWEPRPPSFAGYLGLDTHNFVSSIVKLLRKDRNSSGAPEDLQTSLYNFATIVIATQPGLGAMLLTGEAGRPTLPSSVLELLASTAVPPSDKIKISSLSVLAPTLALLTDWKNTLVTKPTVLPAAMRLLDALWQNAPQYMVILDKLRARPEFWDALDSLFKYDLETESLDHAGNSMVDDENEVQRYCYGKIARTYALRILAFEVYFTRGGNLSPVVVRLVKRIFDDSSAAAGSSTVTLFTDKSKLPYKDEWLLEATTMAGTLDVPVSLAAYRTQAWSDDLDVDAQYGENYAYDVRLLLDKLDGHVRTRATAETTETYGDLAQLVFVLNRNRSMTDAHLAMARAWKKFVQVVSTTSVVKPTTSNAQPDFKLSANHIYNVMLALTDVLMDESRVDPIVIAYRWEISNLLLSLVAVWRDLAKDNLTPNTARNAADLVRRFQRCMATHHYELGPSGFFSQYPFHQELLAGILVGLRILKTQASEQTLRDPETRQIMQELLPVVCKGLSFAIKGLGKENIHASRREIDALLSCLTELVGSTQMMDSATAIAIMDRYDVLNLLVVVFQKALSGAFAEGPTFALDVLSVMLTIAETPLGAERLAVQNVLVYISNNSLSPSLSDGMVKPYVDQHRNPLHRVWCGMLSLATRIVQSPLGGTKGLVEEATGIIRVYETQIANCLDVTTNGDATLGRLEEMSRIVELFYALGSWNDRVGNGQRPDEPDFSILGPFGDYALQAVAHFAYLFDNPNEMHQRIVPVTPGERSRTAGDPPPEQQLPHLPVEQQAFHDEKGSKMGTYAAAARSMLLITRNLIAYLRMGTRADALLTTTQSEDWTHHPVFQPTMAVGAGQSATLGTLFGLVRRITSLLDRRSPASSSSPNPGSATSNNQSSTASPPPHPVEQEVERTLTDAASSLPAMDLLLLAEATHVLAVTQLALYKRHADPNDEIAKEMVGELEPTQRQLRSVLDEWTGDKDKELVEVGSRFLSCLDEFRGRLASE
ncbi:hypothetical protein HKX48_006353, partial [Thoreauomyces humboldtii]